MKSRTYEWHRGCNHALRIGQVADGQTEELIMCGSVQPQYQAPVYTPPAPACPAPAQPAATPPKAPPVHCAPVDTFTPPPVVSPEKPVTPQAATPTSCATPTTQNTPNADAPAACNKNEGEGKGKGLAKFLGMFVAAFAMFAAFFSAKPQRTERAPERDRSNNDPHCAQRNWRNFEGRRACHDTNTNNNRVISPERDAAFRPQNLNTTSPSYLRG